MVGIPRRFLLFQINVVQAIYKERMFWYTVSYQHEDRCLGKMAEQEAYERQGYISYRCEQCVSIVGGSVPAALSGG